jgi:hypothetical protein
VIAKASVSGEIDTVTATVATSSTSLASTHQ